MTKSKVNTRTHVVKIRVSDDEFDMLHLLPPEGYPLASWIRETILGKSCSKEIKRKQMSPDQRLLITEIARIGNNLNQLARLGNRAALVNPETLPELFQWMENLIRIADAIDLIERRF